MLSWSLACWAPGALRYPGREQLAQLVLFTYLLPSVVLIIPLYLLLVGWASPIRCSAWWWPTPPRAARRCCCAPWPASAGPQAAAGSTAPRAWRLLDVILPQALPGIISTAVFTFILAWNEYLFALVLVNQDSSRTLTTGVITMLVTSFHIEWSMLMAASVMMSVPVLVVFAFLQKHLTRGFGAGGVKG
jgi:multiple sugar transport system permease protein